MLLPLALWIGRLEAVAASPNLVDAVLKGPWNLEVTIASYSAPQQPGARPVGHKATDQIWFDSTCPAPGSCSVLIWGPTGPDPSQAAYYTYTSNASGFEGTVGPNPLVQSGQSYSGSIPIGGFGGFKCPPPQGALRPAQSLTLMVTDAKQNGTAWLATTVTGTETLNAGWGCSGGQSTGWITQTLSIVGHPVGYVAPAGTGAPSELRVSSLATALNDPRDAFRNPALVAVNLVVTALVILFVTFPSALFNHTMSEHYAEVTGTFKRLEAAVGLKRGPELAGGVLAGRRRDAAVFVAVLAFGSLINGLLDPRFGFNSTSAVSYAATVLTLIFGVLVSGLVHFTYRRARKEKTDWYLHALPLGLVVAAACVLVSRLTDFQPGYFYGLVCGIAFATHLATREEGHTAAAGALVTMALAVAAWLVWSVVKAHTGSGAAWPVVLIDDFLASVFVGGMIGNVVALLPLRSLQGGTLIAWHRGVWAAVFAIAVFGLVQILLHPEQGAVHPSQAPLVTAIILFVGFGGSSLAFNRYFTWPGRPTRRFQEADA
ncbi:MAG: FGLLP motif-containing membrane protein [Candidatus Dormibacterales bacterium]